MRIWVMKRLNADWGYCGSMFELFPVITVRVRVRVRVRVSVV